MTCAICEEDVSDQTFNHIETTMIKSGKDYTREGYTFQERDFRVGMAKMV
jgi:hypothetical protein